MGFWGEAISIGEIGPDVGIKRLSTEQIEAARRSRRTNVQAVAR